MLMLIKGPTTLNLTRRAALLHLAHTLRVLASKSKLLTIISLYNIIIIFAKN